MPSFDSITLLQKFRSEIQSLIADPVSIPIDALSSLANDISEIFQIGNKIAFVGNGGSAAEAMHLAAEFTGHCLLDHIPLPAMCLNESQSALTAISNDYGQDHMFSRMVEAFLKPGDLLVVLSTSGTSKNIVRAIESALSRKVRVMMWTGKKAPDYEGVEIWRVPSESTPRIQEVHLVWGHLLAVVIEEKMASSYT